MDETSELPADPLATDIEAALPADEPSGTVAAAGRLPARSSNEANVAARTWSDHPVIVVVGLLGSIASIWALTALLVEDDGEEPSDKVAMTDTTITIDGQSAEGSQSVAGSSVPSGVETTGRSLASTTTVAGRASTALGGSSLGGFLGIWSGTVTTQNGGSLSLTLVFDQPLVEASNGIGRFGYGTCRGTLRLLDQQSPDTISVAPDLVPSVDDCSFGGSFDLRLDGDTAAYQWTSTTAVLRRSGPSSDRSS